MKYILDMIAKFVDGLDSFVVSSLTSMALGGIRQGFGHALSILLYKLLKSIEIVSLYFILYCKDLKKDNEDLALIFDELSPNFRLHVVKSFNNVIELSRGVKKLTMDLNSLSN